MVLLLPNVHSPFTLQNIFTFQYGATSTKFTSKCIDKERNLHSNMVLLLPDDNIVAQADQVVFTFQYGATSTSPFSSFTHSFPRFTFQYGATSTSPFSSFTHSFPRFTFQYGATSTLHQLR